MEKLLTPEELSKLFHIKISTIYNWTHIGFVPYIKVGRFVRFKEEEIDKWISAREYKGRKGRKVVV